MKPNKLKLTFRLPTTLVVEDISLATSSEDALSVDSIEGQGSLHLTLVLSRYVDPNEVIRMSYPALRISNKLVTNALHTPQAIGKILEISDFRSLNGLTLNGGIEAAVHSGILEVTSGAVDFTQYISLNRLTSLELLELIMRFIVRTKTSDSYGLGIGTKSINTLSNANRFDQAAFLANETANAGKANLKLGVAMVNNYLSANGLTYNVGDEIEVKLERNVYNFTATVKKVSDATTKTISHLAATYPIASPVMANAGDICIIARGGEYGITYLKVETTEVKNPNIVLIGDSKTSGYATSVAANRYSNILRETYGDIVVNAGGGDGVDEYLLKLPELLALNPKVYIICGTVNTLGAGQSAATIRPKYNTLVEQLSIKARVMHLPGFWDNTSIQDQFVANVEADYGAEDIINIYDEVLEIDGSAHPTDAGDATIAAAILATGKLDFLVPGTTTTTTTTSTTTSTTTAAPGSTIMEDTFNAADSANINGRVPSTPVGSNAWVRDAGVSDGNMGIVSNAAKRTSGSLMLYAYDTEETDIDVTLEIKVAASGDGALLYIADADAANGIEINTRNCGSHSYVAGVGTSLITGSGTTVDGDTVRIRRLGTSIKTYRNGVEIGSATLVGTFNSGKIALVVNGDNNFAVEKVTVTASI